LSFDQALLTKNLSVTATQAIITITQKGRRAVSEKYEFHGTIRVVRPANGLIEPSQAFFLGGKRAKKP
jgi:hypothetical protein